MDALSLVRAVRIDEGCISCGLCAHLVPEVFEVPHGATSRVRIEWYVFAENAPRAEARLLGARDSCPVDVIRVELV